MTGWLRDRESNLIDRGVPHRIVGRIAEAMTFVPSNRVPKQVRDKRAPDELVELAEEGAPEDVIQYQKSVKVYSDEIFKVHTRITCLDEIMRFSVRNFLLRMDEPKKGLTICESLDSEEWSPDGSEEQPTTCTVGLTPLQHVRAAKVYHVNMVLLVSMKDEHGKWISDVEKFRLVLSRDGIERVETGAYSDAVLVQGADAFSNPPTQLPTIENIAAEGQMPSSAVAPPL
jgi:hypothetical protein